MNRYLLILGFLFLISSCKSTKNKTESDFYSENNEINLFAFIGKKMSVKIFERDTTATEKFIGIDGDTVVQKVIYFDQRFKAKYQIEKPLFNNFKKDTISFLVYDHYGRPKFEKYEYAIMYISKSEKENEFYLQKYMYDPVKKNDDGTWSGINGESIKELFENKKNGYLKARGIFE